MTKLVPLPASIMTTLVHAFTQPFYHATCPQFALCLSHATALKPSPPDAHPALPTCPITFSYSGDRATTRSKMPGLDVAHERELFYITSSIIQITKGSAVTLRLAENYLNRITPLITQLRAHKMSEQAGHDDCCWTLASIAPPDSKGPLCPLPSCETSHPALFRKDGSHLILVGGENEQPQPSSVTLPLKLDGDGHLSREIFTQPCHTFDPALAVLFERPVMTLTVALLLAAKTVNETGVWLRRIAHTTVQGIDELQAAERALLRALQWHTTYVPVAGVDSPAIARTLDLSTSTPNDLLPVLREAPTYYQCIPWMLWQYTTHAPAVHAKIANAFLRPCSFVPRDVQQEILDHLAWLSRTVNGAVPLVPPHEWEHAAERRRLDLLVGVVERRPLVSIPLVGPGCPPVRSFRRVSAAARRRESRMLAKRVADVVVKKPHKRIVDPDAL